MIKIVAIVIIFAVIIIYLKTINPELAILAGVAAGVILIIYSLSYLTKVYEFINQIIELSGVNKEYYIIIFKISAIAYLIEFSADTLVDFGLKSLAEKLVFIGKVTILSMSLPIIYNIINLLVELLK